MREPQEVPVRVDRIAAGVKALGFALLTPPDHGRGPLLGAHTEPYLRFLETAWGRWKRPDWGDEVISNIYVREPNPLRGVMAEAAAYLADGSCPVGEHTWRSAYWAAQAAVAGAHALVAGERSAYALCRPPGHHARAAAAGGFCYLNNAAIAAVELRAKFGRVVVLDTDMHHGQGVQEIFYDRADVCYASIHGDPTNFYPVVAGFEEETGRGAGVGCNLNLPMPHGSPEQTFFDKLDLARKAIDRWQPDALVLALGFDIYRDDPQSLVAVSTDGFARLGRAVAAIGLPTLVIQEGGYDIESLALNAQAFFGGFEG